MKLKINSKIVTFGLSILFLAGALLIVMNSSQQQNQGQVTENVSDKEKTEIELRQEIIDSDPKYFDYLIQGHNYLAEGQVEQAHKQYLLAEKLAPEEVDVLVALAKSFKRLNQDDKAIKYYEHLVQIVSEESHPYHVNLSQYQNALAELKGDFRAEEDYEIPL